MIDSLINEKVDPAERLGGEVHIPGDKSISHRAVFLGSIAEGTTTISGFLEGEDNHRTIGSFISMGVNIERPRKGVVVVEGVGLTGLAEPVDVIDAGNSGTTARLLSGLLSAQNFFSVLTGDNSLRSRPMKRIVTPLEEMGASLWGRVGANYLPLAIQGSALKGIRYASPVASAQVKSAILLAGLYAEGDTVVIEPGRSRDHTERMLNYFGADISTTKEGVRIKKAKRLFARDVAVPGDISSAAFFIVAASVVEGSELIIKNVGVNPTRCGIIDIIKKMGGDIEVTNLRDELEPVADIVVRGARLKGIEIAGSDLLPAIDEFPIICVAAALAEGRTVISGGGELRVKESDRIKAMDNLLSVLGVSVEQKSDGLVIEGRKELSPGIVKSFGDHRVAMSAAVAALRASGTVEISGAESVDVSFPGFFNLLEEIRA